MSYFNDQLRELNAQVIQKRRTESKLKELYRQQEELESRVRELDSKKAAEQSDVDKLEGRSLASFFYNVIGKKDEKLDKEQKEAYAARVKYDAAFRELSDVNDEIAAQSAELHRLEGCDQKYKDMLDKKAEQIKSSASPDAERIFAAEAGIDRLENQISELNEAIQAGVSALAITDKIIDELDSAEGWGTWDLLGSGGLVSGMIKHSHLDDAQELVEELQDELRSFKTELADVEIEADMQVSIDGFLRFADYFFDGLFADWAVLDEIENSLEQVKATRGQIVSVIDRLEKMNEATEATIKSEKQHIDELIEEADI